MVGKLLRLERLRTLGNTWRDRAWSELRRRIAGEPPSVLAGSATDPPGATEAPHPTHPTSATPSARSGERPTLAATPHAERDFELRRGEVRARFDALFDRMLALEDTLDAFGKRFALRQVQERRVEERTAERIESMTETLERRGLELEALTSVLGRVELRLERIERHLRDANREPELEATPTFPDELAGRTASDARRLSRSLPEDAAEFLDTAPFSTSSMRGNLAEVSLPTVLGVLELERRTGVLKVIAEDGSIVGATLREGAIVGARVRDLEASPVDAVREALGFERGHFWFRQAGVEVASGPPQSVGSVLLEATRQNDEALRSA